MDYKVASEKLRAFAKTLAEAPYPDGADLDQNETVDRAVARALQFASYDAVRDEFQHFIDANPELKLHVAIGKELMRDNGYGDLDPICGLPGVKPMIAKIDGKEAVCFDASMSNVAPLSAIFANKVKEVMDAAAKVEAAKAKPEPDAKEEEVDAWPLRTAGAGTYNSVEEMLHSDNAHIRGLAESMIAAREQREKVAAQIFNKVEIHDDLR